MDRIGADEELERRVRVTGQADADLADLHGVGWLIAVVLAEHLDLVMLEGASFAPSF
jgi:hypothetical protein